ncbi:MAG TPA: caspase family protein [Phycisphaerales bacterium]|nr:caspase family protein [Phycisphaerales bacterium]HMP37910.1 caspase family protein [Phycisphaerales bacterium]
MARRSGRGSGGGGKPAARAGQRAAPRGARKAGARTVDAGEATARRGAPTHDPGIDEPFPPHARLSEREVAAFEATRSGAQLEAERLRRLSGHRDGIDAGAARSGSSGRLTPEVLAGLRPHVINLVQGRLSDRGAFSSSRADLEALFGEHLPRWIAQREQPARIVLFAHGGLVPESTGLLVAERQRSWWLANGVYPIHFVWETGFLETLEQLIRGGGTRAARSFADRIGDPVIETFAQFAGGPMIWGGMKRSAERAFDAEGGGRAALSLLASALRSTRRAVEVHLAGHSAGSIFLAHLIETAAAMGVPRFPTLSLLAPALTIDDFRRRVMPWWRGGGKGGAGFEGLAIFTMRRDIERADHCARVYRKSLLYLIRNALEEAVPTELLGLEESIRRSSDVASFLGLAGALGRETGDGRRGKASASGEVIWSPTGGAEEAASASHATSHGGFDDDVATMNSLLRRVLARPAGAIVGFPGPGGFEGAGRGGSEGFGEPEPDGRRAIEHRIAAELDRRGIEVPRSLSAFLGGEAAEPMEGALGVPESEIRADAEIAFDLDEAEGAEESADPETSAAAPNVRTGAAPGRRVALCMGIDSYRISPLLGCVADARRWHECLARLGFECRPLMLDADVTRDAIVGTLRALFEAAAPGDIIAIQYSGHGTQVRDYDGDESDGGAMPEDEPGMDEAMVPFDHESGAYVIDDDLAELFRLIPAEVNVTCFFDCCHSGTMNRLWPSRPGAPVDLSERPRRLVLMAEAQRAHLEFRARMARSRGGAVHAARGIAAAGEVFFSACGPDELAWESQGQGDFTRRAMRILQGGIEGLTNESFHRKVLEAFGPRRRQSPALHCVDDRRALPLLGWASSGGGKRSSGPARRLSAEARAEMARQLRSIAQRLE